MIELSTSVRNLLSAELAWHYQVIPLGEENGALELAASSDAISKGLDKELRAVLGRNVQLKQKGLIEIEQALETFYGRDVADNGVINISRDGDVIDQFIQEAKRIGSSDIHIEVYEEGARVRMRVDGQLIERSHIALEDYPAIVNKVKIKANLDIAEKRLPQDGRITATHDGDAIDLRVSILPSLFGEKIVLRLLNRDATSIDLEKLGMANDHRSIFLNACKKPQGLVLISGPTGSGKTTTLYATLKELNTEKRNILTVEDPVEYTLEGINQVQLNEGIGLTFAKALRTFLRQDPDVIMLGEIRDSETAEMAIRAALTGHLVLSTIHTNSAWGTIERLIDMGVPSFLLANTLNLSVAQRLVRKLCDKCKKQKSIRKSEIPFVLTESGELTVFEPIGCSSCFHTGYKGRIAIYEMISSSQILTDSIRENDLTEEEVLLKLNIEPLQIQAKNLLVKGISSVEELFGILSQ